MSEYRIRVSTPNEAQDYDLLIASLGFEKRATNVSKNLKGTVARKIAFGFNDRQELNYADNLAWFAKEGFEVFDCLNDDQFANLASEILSVNADSPDPLRMCVDISSINRSRLAGLVHMFAESGTRRSLVVDFLYSLGAFSSPPDESAPNTYFGPVTHEFAGWTTDPNKPPISIVGLGYEDGKAMGAVEYLQSDETWLLIPDSPETPYLDCVLGANKMLLESTPDVQKMKYRVDDPLDCYNRLESLVYGVSRRGRPVLLPFGPKIFALISMLVSIQYPESSVWRVSAQHGDAAVDRAPSEHVIGLTVHFDQGAS